MVFNINWVGVVLAAISAISLAALWYSPIMFGNTWKNLVKREENGQDRKSRILRKILIVPATLISATMFGALVGPFPFGYAVMAGFGAGFFWVATSIGVSYALEPRPFSLWAINGAYHVLQFTLYGLCIGAANSYL